MKPEQKAMTIFINNTGLNLYTGATVLDALRAYYRELQSGFPEKLPTILDSFGNEIETDGSLIHLQRLYTIDFEYTEKLFEND